MSLQILSLYHKFRISIFFKKMWSLAVKLLKSFFFFFFFSLYASPVLRSSSPNITNLGALETRIL